MPAIFNDISRDIGVNPPSQQIVDVILKEIDIDGDGKMSKTEFKIIMEVILEVMAHENLK